MLRRRSLLAATAAMALAGRSARAQAPVVLSVPWMGWPEEQVRPLMAAFEKSHPGVAIHEERLPIAELFKTLEVRLSSRNALPDFYLVDGPLTAGYAARGHLVDLTPMLQPQFGRFAKAAIDQGMFRGKLYSAPIATSSQLLFYNRKLLAAAGVTPPPPDVAGRLTWEQVVEMAGKLTSAKDGVWGFQFESINPYQLLPVPLSWGAKVISDDGLVTTGYVDGPEMVAAMTWFQELFTKQKVSAPGVFDNGLVQQMFAAGKIAMVLGGTWNLGGFANVQGLEFGTAPHPAFAGKKPVTPTGSWHVGVNPRSQNLDRSLDFVRWMMTEEAMDLWFTLRSYPPVLNSIWQARANTTFRDPAWKVVRFELDNTAVPRPATPGYREYEDRLKSAMQDIVMGGPVAPTLKTTATAIDRELRKYA